MARPSCANESACCEATPPTSAEAPSGRSAAASASVTDWVATARLSDAGGTVTVAVRRPCSVVIEVGPLRCSTVAMSCSGTMPAAVGIASCWRAATVVGGSGLTRYTVRAVSSISTEPICCGRIVFDTIDPTATSDSPTWAAASRSTTTAMYGSASARLSVTCPMPSRPSSSSTTAEVAVARSSPLAADTVISMSLEPKPADAATATSPTSSPRPSIASCTSARSFSWSASPSVRTE